MRDVLNRVAGIGEGAAQAEPVQLLQRVFKEQFEETYGQVPAQRPSTVSGSVHNPHDPEAWWSTKGTLGKDGWVGYKVQVCETAPDEPRPAGEPTEAVITAMVSNLFSPHKPPRSLFPRRLSLRTPVTSMPPRWCRQIRRVMNSAARSVPLRTVALALVQIHLSWISPTGGQSAQTGRRAASATALPRAVEGTSITTSPGHRPIVRPVHWLRNASPRENSNRAAPCRLARNICGFKRVGSCVELQSTGAVCAGAAALKARTANSSAGMASDAAATGAARRPMFRCSSPARPATCAVGPPACAGWRATTANVHNRRQIVWKPMACDGQT
jgi:hypothetical protein